VSATAWDVTLAEARRLGAGAGRNAASWIDIDAGIASKILTGITDGDPEVMDMFREPDLSGEFADDYSSMNLAGDLDLDPDAEDAAEALTEAEDEWLAAASETFWHEVERICRLHAR